jgi:hypothetical protein
VEASKSVGFAIDSKKTWLLYLSIGLLVVGVIGMAFTSGAFKKGGGKEKSNNKNY